MHVENFPLTPLLQRLKSAAKKWLCNNLDNNYESSYFNSLEWPAESAWSIVVENWGSKFWILKSTPSVGSSKFISLENESTKAPFGQSLLNWSYFLIPAGELPRKASQIHRKL